jgi:hypothetical protein
VAWGSIGGQTLRGGGGERERWCGERLLSGAESRAGS